MYEPVIDPETLNADDAELTPIFHALATRPADPVEHFRRDPLDAPLPAAVPVQPAGARMWLRSVPTPCPEPGAPVPAAVITMPSGRRPPSHRAGLPELHGITELRGARGGRHRAPGAGGRGPYAR